MKQFSTLTILSILAAFLCSSAVVSASPINKRGNVPSCYSQAKLTQYWIPKEEDPDMTNNGESVTLSGEKTESLLSKDGNVIAKVSKTTFDKFQMEGTGLLTSGVMVNLGETTSTFMELDRSASPYGLGHSGDTLVPWVSVASNDLPKGTTLYVKELDGLSLPDGKIHNGCVRVDDQGWGLDSCHIDFFVLQFSAYQHLIKSIPETVTVSEQQCEIKDYITSSVKKWAVLS